MADLQTPLSGFPYYQTFNQTKNDARILFKPSVSVQTRELNDLQAGSQQQLEWFADNILSPGTIVQGCNFIFYNPYAYVKLKDLQQDGTLVNPSLYKNLMAWNTSNGLKAQIINFSNGFEATDPNLSTIYLRYLNTGTFSNVFTFAAGDVITILNPVFNGIENVLISNGGIGFSNSDLVLLFAQMQVSMNSGSFTNGDFITTSTGANVQIIGVTNATSNNSVVTIKVQPRTTDLANVSANASSWTISNNQTVTNFNTASGTVVNILGQNYQGFLVTNPSGIIQTIITQNKGAGYITTLLGTPFMTVRSVNNSIGYSSLNLVPQNYVANVTVAGTSNSVGNGYAFGITEGIIYQKGYFIHVVPQTVIVNNYSQVPDGVSVCFKTNEVLINSNIDPTLNDPAAGDNNGAPGADRLRLVANLVVVPTTAVAGNTQLFTVTQFNQGNPFKQQQQTIYSVIGNNMAQRGYETSGNFVIDPFLTTTRSTTNSSFEANNYELVIDPGIAYIDGFRVETFKDFAIDVPKSFTTLVQNNYTINLNYGGYAICNNVAGTFKFNFGDTVYLYSSPKGYLANTTLIQTQNTTPQGSLIGNASIRSMMLLNGTPGQAGAQYKLYLFNVHMANGSNFGNVASIAANNVLNGIADVVQTIGPTGVNTSSLYEQNSSSLVFPTRVQSLKNANNVQYTYRTINTSLTVSNAGILTYDISGTGNEFFPYGANLSAGQMLDLIVFPTQSDYTFNTNLTGTVNASTGTANLVGSSTTFLTQLAPLDYIFLQSNSTGGASLQQVQYVVNNTLVILDKAPAFSNASATAVRTFPRQVPIPFGSRSGLSANLNAAQNILTLNFGTGSLAVGTLSSTLAVSIQRNNITQGTKTANRLQFTKISIANNVGGINGPWCLGVPDIFRLRGVWIGSNSSVSNTGSNYFDNFYIDHNQNTDFLDQGNLYIQQGAGVNVNLTGTSWLLVEYDYFAGGIQTYFDTVSYVGSNAAAIQNVDSQSLTTLTSNGLVNSFEISEIWDSFGNEIDLLNTIDFRPAAGLGTATPSTNPATAPVNPPIVVFSLAGSERKFPLPGSNFNATLEYYQARCDSVVVDQNGNFSVNQGKPDIDSFHCTAPPPPTATMEISQIYLPPYPTIEKVPSVIIAEILNKRILNQNFLTNRIQNSTIQSYANNYLLPFDQPKVYTMADIGNLDRRLADAEYYISLNQLETAVTGQFIGSSANAQINRFKFGYFVDDFTTTIFSNLDDPQYAATKELSDIVPTKLLWDVNLISAIGSVNYVETTIVSQEYATIGNATDPNTQPVCALGLGNTVAYATRFRNWTDNIPATPAANGSVTDSITLTFADLAHILQYFTAAATGGGIAVEAAFPGLTTQQALSLGAGTIQQTEQQLVNNRDPNLQGLTTQLTGVGDLWTFFPSAQAPPVSLYFYTYDTPTLIQVFQGSNFLIDSGSAVNLTAAEQAFLTGPNAANWFNDQTNLFMKNFTSGASNTVQFAGKITWNYNFNASDLITIKTTTTGVARWKWVISFPINGSSVGCIPAPVEWDDIISHCTNGWWVNAGYFPNPNGMYSLTSSTSQYDITQLWQGGSNAVLAPGGTSALEKAILKNIDIWWGH